MSLVRLMILVPALLLGAATTGWSQEPGQAPEPITAHYFLLTAGAAFGSNTEATFAGEYGESVNSHVMAYVNYAYYNDLMTDAMKSNLLLAGNVLTQVTGNVRRFTGRDRGLVLTGGAKFMVGGRNFKPYVGGGFGAMHLERTIIDESFGDVTVDFVGLTDGVIEAGARTTMKPIGEIVGGIYAGGRHTTVDISYRYRTAFNTTESVAFSQFAVGIGYAF